MHLHCYDVRSLLEERCAEGHAACVGVAWSIACGESAVADRARRHVVASCLLAVDVDDGTVVDSEVEGEDIVSLWSRGEGELLAEVVAWEEGGC